MEKARKEQSVKEARKKHEKRKAAGPAVLEKRWLYRASICWPLSPLLLCIATCRHRGVALCLVFYRLHAVPAAVRQRSKEMPELTSFYRPRAAPAGLRFAMRRLPDR